MDVENELGLFEPCGQPGVLLAEDRILCPQRILGRDFSASLLGRQSREHPRRVLATPRRQVRGVESFGAQQGPQAAHRGTGIGQCQDAQRVLRGDPAPGRRGSHLGVRSGDHGGSG